MKKNVKSKAGDGFEKTKIKRVNECRGKLCCCHGWESTEERISTEDVEGTEEQACEVKQGGMGGQTNLVPLSQPGKHAWLEHSGLKRWR